MVAYTNYATKDASNDQPAGLAITNASALRIAKDAMGAAGQPTEAMTLKWVDEEQGGIPPIASMHKISVSWQRTYQGIPFHREGGVILEAETGDVLSIGIGCTSPDPVTTLENVSQNQAASVAEAQLRAVSLSVSDVPLQSIKKEIIHPNTYWQTGDIMQAASESLVSSQSRVVWNCSLGSTESNFEVWVDAETGDVVGGDHSGMLGGSAKRLTPKFGHQLKHMEIGPIVNNANGK